LIEPLLMTAGARVYVEQQRLLTNASGFFLSTRRATVPGHQPARPGRRTEPALPGPGRDRVAHRPGQSDPVDRLLDAAVSQRPRGLAQGEDTGGQIDVAVIELDRRALPRTTALMAFTPEHLQSSTGEAEVGSSLLIVGFPLGFHDALHHLPVVGRRSSRPRSDCVSRARVTS